MTARPVILAWLAVSMTTQVFASEPSPQQTEFFESKIRPILANNCYQCHSAEQGKSKGGLTLDTRAGWMKGGVDGLVITPGDPVNSLLVQAVTYTDPNLQMPPQNAKLSDADIAALQDWVKMGAPDPRTGTEETKNKLTGLTDKARAHWAFQPVKVPVVPEVNGEDWCRTPIDHFILAKLEEHRMKPALRASRETLIRRAYYDLIGLPPTPQDMQDFVADKSPDAFAKIVDRLLASPQYGERWGRHWLDTARYADTQGGDGSGARNMAYRYENAWTYRDYVIDAFNRDKPYDQFILEQIAADKLPIAQEDKTRLAALGFLTVGQRFSSANDVINDRIDVVTKGFLGLGVSCARCHDHKFDPIPTTDYYALHGVFASTVEPQDDPLIRDSDPIEYLDFQLKLGALETQDRKLYYDAVDKWLGQFHSTSTSYLFAACTRLRRDNSTEALKALEDVSKRDHLDPFLLGYLQGQIKKTDPVLGPLRLFVNIKKEDFAASKDAVLADILKKDRKTTFNPLVVAAFQEAPAPNSMSDVLAIYDKLFASIEARTHAYVSVCAAALVGPVQGFDPATAELIEWPFDIIPASAATTNNLRQLAQTLGGQLAGAIPFNFAQINELELTHSGAPARAMVVADAPTPQDSRVFIRGQAQVQGEVVHRHFLEILSPNGKPERFKDGSGRIELARDIANPNNPLTARVMVNRVWMYHFGEGFVRTPDNLGTQSEPPSHPELLDYLADYFVKNDWSLKKLHRLIMLSSVYQESSHTRSAYEQIDSENRLLWRANIRRLDFESLRDSLLAFSGKLDLTTGGAPVNLTDEPYSYRRSVYGYIDRGHLPELMQEFDFSDPSMPNSKRDSTIVPQQALFLMNSPMVIDVARRLMSRPEVVAAIDDTDRIAQLYRIVFQRLPNAQETQLGLQFVMGEINIEASLIGKARIKPGKVRSLDKGRKYSATRPIQNKGDFVDRMPLTPWETYAQALLFSNEASYVN